MSKRSNNPRGVKKTKKNKKSAPASRTKKSASKAAIRGRRGKGARSARTRARTTTRARAQPKKKRTEAKGRRVSSKKFFVRIFGSGQYTISKNTLNKLNKLDNNIVKLLNKGEEDSKAEGQFREVVSKMVSIVKKEGKPIPPEDIVPSHAIIPDQQITIEEARRIFSGEGAVPEHLVF